MGFNSGFKGLNARDLTKQRTNRSYTTLFEQAKVLKQKVANTRLFSDRPQNKYIAIGMKAVRGQIRGTHLDEKQGK